MIFWKKETLKSLGANPGFAAAVLLALSAAPCAAGPVQTSYLWHLHQPIYWPDQRANLPDHYETAWDTIVAKNAGRVHPGDDVASIFGIDDRIAAYQFRPHDSIQTMLGQPDAGAQVTYSGALMENVNSLSNNQSGYFSGWQQNFIDARGWTTSGGKPRMDLINFTCHHSMGPLMSQKTFEMELKLQQRRMQQQWGSSPALSRGFFPAEMAFSERLIPTLKAQGIDWAVVSSNHLSRACAGFPLVFGSGGENCEPPNGADVQNPAQSYYNRLTISRGCAPANAAPFSYTPHKAQYIDPSTGVAQTITVVPSAQEFSWLDGYECFGADQISPVASQSNPTHPELILLAHDGDNAFGGGYSYYMQCVQDFVSGAASAGYNPTTVEQYLASYPVSATDIVHVEDGAWVNADSDFGSPAYLNWLWPLLNASGQDDPVNGWHEKAREYAIYTAAENRVRTAEQVSSATTRIDEVLDPAADATAVERAWHYYLGSLDSGEVYYGSYDDVEVKGTIGCNNATSRADTVLTGGFTDQTAPTLFMPQRWPYNPGGINFGADTGYQQKTLGPDFTVWTFAYDVSGLGDVTLYWRADNDGQNPIVSTQNETYAGGSEVGAWQTITMARRPFPATNVYNKPELDYYVLPTYIADHCSATITGQAGKLIDYYIQATDTKGNVAKTDIMHVYVGTSTGSSSGGGGTTATVVIRPSPPTAGAAVNVSYDPSAGPLAGSGTIMQHYGVNNWATVNSPDVAMTLNNATSRWETTVTVAASATQFDVAFNNGASTWDNNSGADWHFPVSGGVGPPWTIDGVAESNALMQTQVSGGLKLWATISGNVLYVGTQGAANSRDHFIFIARNIGALEAAPWGKAGQVMTWDAFLANESTNNFSGWYNSTGGQTLGSITTKTSGGSSGVLEGTIDLQALYGSVPGTVYIAACEYGTNDGDALVSSTQAPATTNSNGNVESTEFFPLSTAAVVVITNLQVE